MSAGRANVASIPPGVSFLPALVRACLDGSLGVTLDPNERDFSHAVFYVPTRRAARALAHAFADALQPRAVLLPRIVPLGDSTDLEEREILQDSPGFAGDDGLPPAISSLGRRLLLTRLTQGWTESAAARELALIGDGFSLGRGFADCYGLAGELARLIDEVTIEGADWSRLRSLVDGPFDTYWQKTLGFLEIAGTAWPGILAEQGWMDATDRQNRLLRAEAERLRQAPPAHPVIAAGSTGTVPATATLLAAIARLPQGAVVLPGLDLSLDDTAWAMVADDDGIVTGETARAQTGHPQSALKRLLPRLGIVRADVREIALPSAPALVSRNAIMTAAAFPAEATAGWPASRAALADRAADALAKLAIIEAADEREEAAAIAVALREVLEDPAKTAALITPDRALAERVSAELRRWGVRADDSAGVPLARTPLAALALLVLNAAREQFRPASVLALLQSPCIAWQHDKPLSVARAALEIAGFRGNDVENSHDLPSSLASLRAALDDVEARRADYRAPAALKRLSDEALTAARVLLALAADALAPLATDGPRSIADFATAHATALEALAGDRATEGADGRGLAALLDALVAEGATTIVSLADYAAVFSAEADTAVIPPAEPMQGRIKIWGLLEARLIHADRIVLGGLNEGIWPPQPRQDMLLNRSMRLALGLSLPERRIGQSAHDFAMALGAPECVIARAVTVEGTPMVASRFLRRLEAFVGEDAAQAIKSRGHRYRDAARELDDGQQTSPASRPNPRPPAALQPLSLSVTEIATLKRDPYAIYARHILGLESLDPIESGPDARDRGNIIHDALARFVDATKHTWPDDPEALLLHLGRDTFQPFMKVESVAAFWWPMFEKAAAWFVDDMERRRALVLRSIPETSGKMPLALADGTVFTLRGRGDLVEVLKDGTLVVTDYKTGRAAGAQEVKGGLQPQLTLMAAMAAAGVLLDVPKLPVSGLRYVLIKGAPQVATIRFKPDEPDIAATATDHVKDLVLTLSRLRAGETGFLSRRIVQRTSDRGVYDHLARVKEWSGVGEDDSV